MDEVVAGPTADAGQEPWKPVGASVAVGGGETHVLLESSAGNLYASRSDAGTWTKEPAPGSDTGAITLSPAGALRIVGDGPDTTALGLPSGTSIWTRSIGGWDPTDFLPGDLGSTPYSTTIDSQGAIHTLVNDSVGLAFVRWAGAFALQDIAGSYGAPDPSIAVAPSGRTYAVFWATPPPSGGWTVTWATDDGPSQEGIATLGANLYGSEGPFALGVAGGGTEQPHLLFVGRTPPGTAQAFVVNYATRRPSSGTWSIQALAIGDADEFPTGPPQPDGGTGYTTYRPISVLVDGAGASGCSMRSTPCPSYLRRPKGRISRSTST